MLEIKLPFSSQGLHYIYRN